MNERAIFLKRILLTGLIGAIISLKSLVMLPILTKTLGVTIYGEYVLVLTTLTFIESLIQVGLGSSIVRFLPSKSKEEIGQGIITSLVFCLLIGLIPCFFIFIFSDTIAIHLFKDKSLSILFKFISPLILLDAFIAISSNFFRISGQIKKESVVLLCGTVLEIAVSSCALLAGYGLNGFIISLLVARLILFVTLLYCIISYAGIVYPNLLLIHPYVRYGFPFALTALLEIALYGSDRYVINYFLGTGAVGVYSVAYSLGGIVSLIGMYIMRILYPTISLLYDKGLLKEVKIYLSNTWKYMLMLYIPSIVGLAILSKQIISILTTAKFAENGIFIVPIVALGTAVYGIYGLYGGIISLLKNTKLFTISTIFAVLVNIIINFMFIPTYGIMAAAVSTLISYIICVIIMSQKAYIEFDKDYLFIGKCICASLVMALFIWKLNPIGKLDVLLSVIFGGIIYFSILVLLKVLDVRDILSIMYDR